MSTSAQKQLAELTLYARALGYRVRMEHLDGCGGGLTNTNGIRWILLDDMQTAEENLRLLLGILRADMESPGEGLQPTLRKTWSPHTVSKAA